MREYWVFAITLTCDIYRVTYFKLRAIFYFPLLVLFMTGTLFISEIALSRYRRSIYICTPDVFYGLVYIWGGARFLLESCKLIAETFCAPQSNVQSQDVMYLGSRHGRCGGDFAVCARG